MARRSWPIAVNPVTGALTWDGGLSTTLLPVSVNHQTGAVAWTGGASAARWPVAVGPVSGSLTYSAAAEFMTDTFTGTNGTNITAHAPDTGGGTWTRQGGVASLILNGSGKVALSAANSSYTYWLNSAAPSSADYSVSVDVTPASATDNEAGPALRVSNSAATFITAAVQLFTVGNTRAVIGQSVAGAVSLVGAAGANVASFSTSDTYRYTLSGVGTTVTFRVQRLSDSQYLNGSGAWQAGVTDAASGTTTVTAAGFPGIAGAISVSNGTLLDNFSASA